MDDTLGGAHAPGCRYSLPRQIDVQTLARELDAERCPRCRYLVRRLPRLADRAAGPNLLRPGRKLAVLEPSSALATQAVQLRP